MCVPVSRRLVSRAGEPFSFRPSPAAIIISIPVHGPMNMTNEQEITDARFSNYAISECIKSVRPLALPSLQLHFYQSRQMSIRFGK
uniref:Uncharacterized protein n=1 Tax=Wuchereria bancrofti TaxID=6293 RepID=A0AAF5Q492_WUCBA